MAHPNDGELPGIVTGNSPKFDLLPALHDSVLAGRVALTFPDRSLTYGELRAAASAVAAAVAGRSRVAVVAENRIETCVAVIGALEAGVPVIPLNPRSGSRELEHIVTDAAPEAILTAADTPLPGPLSAIERIVVDPEPGPAERPAADRDPEDPALIVYTSGTTGPPKGAVLPRRAIATNLDALAQIWEWTGEDVVAHGLPLFHVHGLVIGILGPIRRGGTALHVGRFTPEAIGAALQQATMLFGVPTMYRRLADAAETDPVLVGALTRTRVVVSGSAPLPAAERERLARLTGRDVLERYGMTETLMNTGIRVGGRPAPGTVGPPLPGVQLRLIDDDGSEVTADETIGEVQVRGPNLFLGYLNRSDPFTDDGWFKTGDMATQSEDGYIRLVGRRATDLIKSGGYKIGAGEIEASLREHPTVLDAAVTAEPDDDLGERIVAWVVLRDSEAADNETGAALRRLLIEHVAAQLAPHKRPRVVHFVDELPRNELGKVVKSRLRTARAAPSS